MKPASQEPLLTPPAAAFLQGNEPLAGIEEVTVLDFWRFAMPDLRVNNARGVYAEFLVHQAVGSRRPRVEWAGHDVETADGLRIEVKTSAYVQAWEQRGPSAIRFGGLRARAWSPLTGYSSTMSYNADVYVFAVQTAVTHADYDPLDTAQWDFYVLPRRELERRGVGSLGLKAVRDAAGAPVSFSGLGVRIHEAALHG